ncbi:MAG: peptidoglycan/xylan/chitin deacetylase (PgdA/CDA1 family) [Parasphingorhabdus sp.]
MLKQVKDLIFSTADKLLWSGGVRILMYHGCCIGDPGLINRNGKHVEKKRLYAQLNGLLKKGWKALSLEQLHGYLQYDHPVPEFSFLVTFDDGFASNYEVAFPVLKELGVPAVIYITTSFVDANQPLWPDRVEYALCNSLVGKIAWENDDLAFDLSLENDNERLQATSVIKRSLKSMSEVYCLQRVNELESMLKIRLSDANDSDLLKPLGWQQCREMAESGWVSIGAHTVNHPILSRCELNQAREEITQSKYHIEKELDQVCDSFAFPNGGASDFTNQTLELLKDNKFKSAMTTINGLNERSQDHLQLFRYGINNYHSATDVSALLQVSRHRAAQWVSNVTGR